MFKTNDQKDGQLEKFLSQARDKRMKNKNKKTLAKVEGDLFGCMRWVRWRVGVNLSETEECCQRER